jgi:hypothetical protein
MNILWTIVIGFVAGVIAKVIHPGSNEPAGFIATTLIGICGDLSRASHGLLPSRRGGRSYRSNSRSDYRFGRLGDVLANAEPRIAPNATFEPRWARIGEQFLLKGLKMKAVAVICVGCGAILFRHEAMRLRRNACFECQRKKKNDARRIRRSQEKGEAISGKTLYR